MRSDPQEVCKRENSVEINEFKNWELTEIGLEMKALEVRKLEIFLFWINQNFQVLSKIIQNFLIFLILYPLPMSYIYRQVINNVNITFQVIGKEIKSKKDKNTRWRISLKSQILKTSRYCSSARTLVNRPVDRSLKL